MLAGCGRRAARGAARVAAAGGEVAIAAADDACRHERTLAPSNATLGFLARLHGEAHGAFPDGASHLGFDEARRPREGALRAGGAHIIRLVAANCACASRLRFRKQPHAPHIVPRSAIATQIVVCRAILHKTKMGLRFGQN